MRVGLDVGSTTIKCVVLDDLDNLIYSTYERHYSHIVEKSAELLRRVAERCGREAVFAISGSAGMGMAESVKAPFVQEVFATRVAANRLAPGTDVIIELGGEDAKILFLTNGMEVRMNGSCAGGTGAFIDQMATLLKMSAEEMDKAAQTAEKTYTIAARCGVFAKSDIQPLINQGAKSADIAKSIYQAVVNQTIAGLAQGRPIKGHVLYLGGPLTFSKCLRQSFDETLGVTGTCPENSLLFVALGAAFYAEESWDLLKTAELLEQRGMSETYRSQPPLFENQAEYDAFKARHAKAAVPQAEQAQGRRPLATEHPAHRARPRHPPHPPGGENRANTRMSSSGSRPNRRRLARAETRRDSSGPPTPGATTNRTRAPRPILWRPNAGLSRTL